MSRTRWKGLVVLLSLVFMGWLLMGQWQHIRVLHLEFRPVILLTATTALVVTFFLDAYGWHLILRALGHHLQPHESIWIWMVSSLTRYLPGGVWGYLSRAAMCTEHGVPLMGSSLSLYLETLLLMTSSLAVGFPALLTTTGFILTPWSAVSTWLVLGALMHPRIIALTHRIPGRPGRLLASAKLPSAPQTFGLYGYYLLFWILYGTIFIGFVQAIYPLPSHMWMGVGASLSLSFLIGFIAVFIPSGLGVRESVLYLLLLPFMPPSVSLVVAIGSRFWIMVGEGISIALAMVLFRHHRTARRSTNP